MLENENCERILRIRMRIAPGEKFATHSIAPTLFYILNHY